MEFEVAGFDWDDGNRTHCQKHGVTAAEIETVFGNNPRVAPDPKHCRPAFVVFTLRAGRIRPLSARYMHAEEIARYEE